VIVGSGYEINNYGSGSGSGK